MKWMSTVSSSVGLAPVPACDDPVLGPAGEFLDPFLLRVGGQELLAAADALALLHGHDLLLEGDQQGVHFQLVEGRFGAGQGILDPPHHGVGVDLDLLLLEVAADLVAEAVADLGGFVLEHDRVGGKGAGGEQECCEYGNQMFLHSVQSVA